MTLDLVTGGAGFIDSHLVRSLLEDGRNVRVLDNLVTGNPDRLSSVKDKIDFVEGDAANPDIVSAAMQGVGQVYHLAAIPSVSVSQSDPLLNQYSGEVAALNILHQASLALYGFSMCLGRDKIPTVRVRGSSLFL